MGVSVYLGQTCLWQKVMFLCYLVKHLVRLDGRPDVTLQDLKNESWFWWEGDKKKQIIIFKFTSNTTPALNVSRHVPL